MKAQCNSNGASCIPFPPRAIANGVKDPYRSLQRMKIPEGLQLWLKNLNTGRTSRRYEDIADAAVSAGYIVLP